MIIMMGEREERRGSGSLLILLAGGLVGAGIALLYAPLSGEETRRYLRMQKERARSRTQNLTENVKENVSEVVDEVKGTIDKMIEEGVELTKGKKAELLAAIEAGKKAMEAERKRLNALSTEDAEE
jgi:gas vesicle protein